MESILLAVEVLRTEDSFLIAGKDGFCFEVVVASSSLEQIEFVS